jgi:glycosyltransferase involved in cell wall biosynthesis
LVVTGTVVAGRRWGPLTVIVELDGRPFAVGPVTNEASPGSEGSRILKWRVTGPFGPRPAGEIAVGARVMGADGLSERLGPWLGRLPESDYLAAPSGREAGHVDTPRPGAVEIGGLIVVSGWVTPVSLVDRVEVRLDDDPPQRALLFEAPRPDVTVVRRDPTAILSGFWHAAPVGDRAPETGVRVRVEAVFSTGRVVLCDHHVVVGGLQAAPEDAAPPPLQPVTAPARAPRARGDGGLHVLMVTHDLGLGGAQLWAQRILLRLLAEPDTACTVLTPVDGPLRTELEQAGARVRIVPPYPGDGSMYELMIRQFAEEAAACEADVVFSNTMGAFMGVDVAARCGLGSVLAVHEHYPMDEFLHAAFGRVLIDDHVRRRAHDALHRANAVSFVADATLELYAPYGERSRFVRVDYTVPRDPAVGTRRSEMRFLHGYPDEATLLLCVRSVESRKSQGNLVVALARVLADRPETYLALVGADHGAYAQGVQQLAAALGIGQRVKIVPTCADVDAWYDAADGFVLASDVESLPRSIMEAMDHGLVVLATDVGGIRELVEDGRTGMLCPRRDLEALTRQMGALLSLSPDRRADLGRQGAAVIARRSAAHYEERYLEAFRLLAKDPAARAASLFPVP